MTNFRYDGEFKARAIRRVVRDGRRVSDVAQELGISEGSLFFWVRRYRQLAGNRQRITSLVEQLQELEGRVRSAEEQLRLRDLHASNAERIALGDAQEPPPQSLAAYLRSGTG